MLAEIAFFVFFVLKIKNNTVFVHSSDFGTPKNARFFDHFLKSCRAVFEKARMFFRKYQIFAEHFFNFLLPNFWEIPRKSGGPLRGSERRRSELLIPPDFRSFSLNFFSKFSL